MPLYISRRLSYLLAGVVCLSLLSYAYAMEYLGGLEPCPLCTFQRGVFIVLALGFLTAAWHDPGPTGARAYGIGLALLALLGAGLAGRHVWLQSQPPSQAFGCGPGLDYMLEVLPFHETVLRVLRGTGDCASIDWSFLGLSMPGWSLIWFLLLGLGGIIGSWLPHQKPQHRKQL